MLNESLKIDVEKIAISELADEKFSLKKSVSEAKRILEDLKDEDIMITGKFEDDVWIFQKHLIDGFRVYYKFGKVGDFVAFNPEFSGNQFKDIVKCWCAELLTNYYPGSVERLYSYFLEAVEITHGFRLDRLQWLLDSLQNDSRDNVVISVIIIAVLNFLDYADLKDSIQYKRALVFIAY